VKPLFTLLFFLSAFTQVSSAQSLALDSNLATRQLVLDLTGNLAYLNGQPVTLAAFPRVSEGKTLLPVREVARLLGLSLETTTSAPGFRLGKLELYPSLRLARVDGRQVALSEVGALQEDVLFIAVKSLEQYTGVNAVFDATQRLITLTHIPGTIARDTTRPVARFTTDKREYKLGEPVRIIEFSYDPDGQPISLNFVGRQEAYFSPGEKRITLIATNRGGRSSDPHTVQFRITSDVFASPRDYALRFTDIGRTFPDSDILSYPVLASQREDSPKPLMVSNSPEVVTQSGILYEDSFNGSMRLLAYHINQMPRSARFKILITNTESTPTTVHIERFGETVSTRIVAVLGQVSLMDFLTSGPREALSLAPKQTLAFYVSEALATGHGLNIMADLISTGKVTLSLVAADENAVPSSETISPAAILSSLSVLEPDRIHVRGTFVGATRNLRVRMEGNVGKVVIGDGILDPHLEGFDALTGEPVKLRGNYAVTYQITLENSSSTALAFSARGGMYAGAVCINGLLQAVPENGVLSRPDSPLLLHREIRGDSLQIELVPASGSFLPINLIFYRLESLANFSMQSVSRPQNACLQ
jgi:hypothetical protein